MQRFDNINKGKDYDNRIKPFNFFIVGVGNDEITPILPFTRQIASLVSRPFVEYKTGRPYANGSTHCTGAH